jgi:hypothetical protein
VSDFLVPNQVNWTRQAAIVVRSRSAGVLLSVLVRPLVDRDSRRSIKVLIEPPEKIKADRGSTLNIVISCPSQNEPAAQPFASCSNAANNSLSSVVKSLISGLI